MNVRACPNVIELERGFFEQDASIRAHATMCTACASEWKQIESLRAFAGSLRVADSTSSSTSSSHEQLRRRLVAARPAPMRARRGVLWLGAVAAAAAVVVVAVTLDRPSPPAHRGVVHAIGEANYWTLRAQPDELVRLVEGTINVVVAELAEGERFRIVTGDGEVEVRGTSFDVVAEDDRLVAVFVHSGAVELRAGGESRVLHAGARWSPPPPPPSPPPLPSVPDRPPAQTPVPKPKPVPKITVAPQQPAVIAEDQVAYEAGWLALRTDDHAAAADHFRKTIELTQDPALELDAQYFLAVSLARAGNNEAAIEAFELFLASSNGAPHEGEAAAALGWLRYDRRELERAEILFRRAIDSTSVRAQKSARQGLDALRTLSGRSGR